MSKIKKKHVFKHLVNKDTNEKKDFMPKGEYFNWYTDNYLIHSVNDKTFMTQWYVDTESTNVEMAIVVSLNHS